MNNSQESLGLTFIPLPTYSGGYWIGGNGVCFNLVKKPKWIHRFFCRICLGWVWINN